MFLIYTRSLARVAIASLAFAVTLIGNADQKTGTLDLYWLDSEGGGSTLIVTPENESVLIDSGNPGGRDPARIVAAARAAGLTQIDVMLLTHFHIDHFGGAAEIAEQIPIRTIYQRAIPAGDPDGKAPSMFPLTIKPYLAIPAERRRLAAGLVIPLKSGPSQAKLELRCLGADQKFVEPTPAQSGNKNPLTGTGHSKEVDTTDNANSAVFVLSFGAFRFFDGGDLTWNVEEKLVTPYNLPGEVDVYQTDHHGLKVSNNPVLIQSLKPTVVVMNNGPHKGGQPGTFASIRSAKSVQALYQVHRSYNGPDAENAPAEFLANSGDLQGAEAAKCPGNLIKLSVAPDGASYTITVPSTGHAQTYKTKP